MLNYLPLAVEATEMDPFVQIITGVGTSGILVWFMWYAISRVLPETRKEFTDTLKQLSADNTKAHEDARKDFRDELAIERATREKIAEHCDARHAELAQRCVATHCANFRYCPSGEPSDTDAPPKGTA